MMSLRLTEEDLKRISARMGARTVLGKHTIDDDRQPGKKHAPGARLNKTETRYAQELEYRKKVGEIRDWKFEAIRLRLADNTTYTPDFDIWMKDGSLEFHETKGGFIRDDAMVKLKVAAEMYAGHKFVLVQYKNGVQTTKRIGGNTHELSQLHSE